MSSKKVQRFLACMLALVMVVSLCGVTAFAAEEGSAETGTLFVGFQPDTEFGLGGNWVSFSDGVDRDETQILESVDEAYVAEYVNGLIYFQTSDFRLYGITYEDLLAGREPAYITALEHEYWDFAYNYKEGKLYGLAQENGTSFISIDIAGGTYAETWEGGRGDIEGYTLAIDDEGALYVLAAENSAAVLWKFVRRNGEPDGSYIAQDYRSIGDTGIPMNYGQSMAWDHNSEKLYWAQFYVPASGDDGEANLYEVDTATAECTLVGDLTDKTQGLFAPLSAEAAEKPAHSQVPEVDTDTVATPVLTTHSLTMTIGSTSSLTVLFDPWYSNDKEIEWTSSNPEVATVKNGVITALSEGAATIRASSKTDPSKYDECSVSVASLTVELEGYVSYSNGELEDVGESMAYTFTLTDGVAKSSPGRPVTATGRNAGHGLMLASSVLAGDTIVADEWGNAGIYYTIDPGTNEVTSWNQPIGGDTLYGLAYSEATDRFVGIMNMYLYVDLPLPLEGDDLEDMFATWETDFDWHRINMRPYLDASQGNIVTPEFGQGSDGSIVISGITSMPGSKQSGGQTGMGAAVNYSYTADVTWVMLDNVGRLWYIDELTGAERSGNGYIRGEDYVTPSGTGAEYGVIGFGYADGSYSVFVIRDIVETPLLDKFWADGVTYTYHFNDLHYAGEFLGSDEVGGTDTSPIFFLSLYDYWNNGSENEFYMYVQNRKGETKGSLYDLGNLGIGYMIATINRARYISGIGGRALSGDAGVSAIMVSGKYSASKYDDSTWVLELPYGTASLPAAKNIEVKVAMGATVSAVTGPDADGNYTFTVTAENGTEVDYTLRITIAKEAAKPVTITLVDPSGPHKYEVEAGSAFIFPDCDVAAENYEFFGWSKAEMDHMEWSDELYSAVYYPGTRMWADVDTTLYAAYAYLNFSPLELADYVMGISPKDGDFEGKWALIGWEYDSEEGFLFDDPYALNAAGETVRVIDDPEAVIDEQWIEFYTPDNSLIFKFKELSGGAYSIQNQDGKYLALDKSSENGLTFVNSVTGKAKWTVKVNDMGNGFWSAVLCNAAEPDMMIVYDYIFTDTICAMDNSEKIGQVYPGDIYYLWMYMAADEAIAYEYLTTSPEITDTGSGNGGNGGGNTGGNTGGGGGTTTPPGGSGVTEPDTAVRFVDVSKDAWYDEAVTFVAKRGLMQGVGDNKFAPDSTTTRGQLMTILARLKGVETDGGATWYEKGMEWAVENGISDGTSPEAVITREQMATMLWRYAGEPEASEKALADFPDEGDVSDYARTALAWAVKNGIINGTSVGGVNYLAPQGSATRAQMAAMLQRFCVNILGV